MGCEDKEFKVEADDVGHGHNSGCLVAAASWLPRHKDFTNPDWY